MNTTTQHPTDAPASGTPATPAADESLWGPTVMRVSDYFQWQLAEQCAGIVHAAVISQHLALLEDRNIDGRTRELLAEMRALIRSISDRWKRRNFVGTVGFLFKKMRQESGTDVRGRDYVARVRAFEAQEAARRSAKGSEVAA